MEKRKVKVLSGFRLTIPEETRARLPIRIGEELEFTVDGNKLVYIMRELPEDPVFTMIGLVKGGERELGEVEKAVTEDIEAKFKRSQK